MELEKRLVDYIFRTKFEDIPQGARSVVKNMILTILGTTIAGATAEGCEALVEFVREVGGKEEATILIHGGRVPAQNAAFVNSVMARALDFDDAMAPGIHIGASAVPTALAAAELVGGCSGKEFLTALVLGAEVAARLNLTESAYDGFDPTGVCGIFAAAVAASKILRLNATEIWNALALAFNKSGGSFQSNIDGSLAVRVIQGWVSQGGMTCALFARMGITGPKNFLEGVYGYFHLYAKDIFDPEAVVGGLGNRFELQKLIFKKYPSCGLTLGSTDAILSLIEEGHLVPEDVDRIDIMVPPYTYKLVGHQFQIGDNPRVNAQFSIQYCVANALVRRGSKLHHFEESYVKDPQVMELIKKIHVISDPALEKQGHTALEMRVLTTGGNTYLKSIDIAPGFPGNPLTKEEHEGHFWDCIDFSKRHQIKERAEEIVSLVNRLEELEDVCILIPLLLS
ncbi:MAG: MmgE/PrpD family protein [Deltaproteobacteria bacterium]|nr:MAG: MmgE/PrpD family protein [Deltaproteobacteria bacterium]